MLGVVVVAVGAFGLTGCVADPPPIMGTSSAGDGRAVVSWQPPLAAPAPVTAYVVTAWVGQVGQAPVVFNSTATTQIVGGLTNGVSYMFTVHARNALGNDSAESGSSNPVVPGPQLAAGYDHTCAIRTAGTVKCWGSNSYGQLGDGSTATWVLTPVSVVGLTGASAITASDRDTCALLTGGSVECWGFGFFGSLGNGGTANSSVPVAVAGITDATAIAAGDVGHVCALLSGGTVKCWGPNDDGQLGDGTTTTRLTLVSVIGVSGATAIGAGYNYTCAVVTAGAVKCWGTTPTTVTGLTAATAVTAGDGHTCVRVPGGAAKCWGNNSDGQLGNGTTDSSVTPVAVSGLTGARVLAAGWFHTCAIVDGAAAKCWGDNSWGQVGDSTNNDRYTPVPVTSITNAIAITAGGYHTCASLTNGTVMCWGDNESGQLGTGFAGGASWTPVAVSGL
jgi:alpha-tubulin suppressor-like RCC1 family protein